LPRSRLFALLCLIVCVVLSALALLNLFHLDFPPFVFLGQLTIPALSLAAALGFIGLVLQFKRVVAFAAIAVCLFGVGLTPWLKNRAFSPPAPGPSLKVVYAYTPSDARPSRLLRNFIARTNPDIIILGEPSFDRTAHDLTVFGTAYTHQRQIGRFTLLSKSQLDDIRVDFFDDRFLSLKMTSAIGPLNLTVVRLPKLWPYSDWGDYDIELQRLEKMSHEARGKPTLIIGDFNAALSAAPLLGYVDKTGYKPVTSPIGTWPARMPPYVRLAVDNAFISPELTATQFSVGPEYSSDHRPIAVNIQIRSSENQP
jgi:endonuclease/exonuclease/phosphatase family metal-dependent hydrolase